MKTQINPSAASASPCLHSSHGISIYVFVTERKLQTNRENSSMYEELSEDASYRWYGAFNPDLAVYHSNTGSCPILILCAADLASTCRSLMRQEDGNEKNQWTISFRVPKEIKEKYSKEWKKIRALTEQEQNVFNSWFQGTYSSF